MLEMSCSNRSLSCDTGIRGSAQLLLRSPRTELFELVELYLENGCEMAGH